MDINKLIIEHINKHPKYTKKNDGVYRPKLNCFQLYLDILKQSKNLDCSSISERDFLNSIDYYIRESNKKLKKQDRVESIETVKIYIVVIRDFYNFLYEKGINNDSLTTLFSIWRKNSKEYQKAIDLIKENHNLNYKKTKPLYSEEEINEVRKKYLELLLTVKKTNVNINQIEFRKFIASLIVVFISETGIRVNYLNTIKINDIDFKRHLLIRNFIEIPLSKEVIEGIKTYLKVCINKKDEKPLFNDIGIYKNVIDAKYLYIFLNIFERRDITGVIKYRINEFRKYNIPVDVIKKLTGVKDDLFDQEWLRENIDDYKYINMQIYNAFGNKK